MEYPSKIPTGPALLNAVPEPMLTERELLSDDSGEIEEYNEIGLTPIQYRSLLQLQSY